MDYDYQNTAQTHSTNSDIKNYEHVINLQYVGCVHVCVSVYVCVKHLAVMKQKLNKW